MMLINEIKKNIDMSNRKRIPFSAYMELILYHPEWGYYNQNRNKIGKQGDFYTSSSVGNIFGEMWAEHFLRVWAEMGKLPKEEEKLILLEIGGGTGHFAHSVLETLRNLYPDFYSRLCYCMIEQSEYHLGLQADLLAAHQDRMKWFKDLNAAMDVRPTIIFSNELFDALPVDRVRMTADGLYECWVEVKDDQLCERWVPLEREELWEYLQQMEIELPVGHQIEISQAAKKLYADLVSLLAEGYIFTIDYGWKKDELLHPARKNGTLIGYLEHRHITDFYQRPGAFDLTAHVHFEALMQWGEEMGVETVSYLTQREWLLSEQILNKLREHQDPNPFSAVAKRNRSIIQLITPGGMGDVFKVLTQKKRVE